MNLFGASVWLCTAAVLAVLWLAIPEPEPAWMARDRALLGQPASAAAAGVPGLRYQVVDETLFNPGETVGIAHRWMLHYPVTVTYHFRDGILYEIAYQGGSHFRPLGDYYFGQLVDRCTRQFGAGEVRDANYTRDFRYTRCWHAPGVDVEATARDVGAFGALDWTYRWPCPARS